MSTCQPYSIDIPDSTLDAIREKVAAYPWHEMPDDGGWQYGTNLDYMKELADYWVNEFDWRKQEAAINPAPMPLLLSHGWPGSVVELTKLIEPLAHPERFGGDVKDAFDVIAPSLPGFGFSGRPPRPYGPRKIAGVLNSLITDVLKYDGYLAQGGDWGGTISSWIGYDHAPACRAIHINILTLRHPDGPQSPEEESWAARFEQEQIMENGYRTLQATRPQTLSYAMMDSPVGIAAWLVEKFNSWSDDGKKGGAYFPKRVSAPRCQRHVPCSRRKCRLGHLAPMLTACSMSSVGPICPAAAIFQPWKSLNC